MSTADAATTAATDVESIHIRDRRNSTRIMPAHPAFLELCTQLRQRGYAVVDHEITVDWADLPSDIVNGSSESVAATLSAAFHADDQWAAAIQSPGRRDELVNYFHQQLTFYPYPEEPDRPLTFYVTRPVPLPMPTRLRLPAAVYEDLRGLAEETADHRDDLLLQDVNLDSELNEIHREVHAELLQLSSSQLLDRFYTHDPATLVWTRRPLSDRDFLALAPDVREPRDALQLSDAIQLDIAFTWLPAQLVDGLMSVDRGTVAAAVLRAADGLATTAATAPTGATPVVAPAIAPPAVVPPEPPRHSRTAADAWIAQHGSNTLRLHRELGYWSRALYLEERLIVEAPDWQFLAKLDFVKHWDRIRKLPAFDEHALLFLKGIRMQRPAAKLRVYQHKGTGTVEVVAVDKFCGRVIARATPYQPPTETPPVGRLRALEFRSRD